MLPAPVDRLIVFLAASVTLVLTPGPDTVYVLARGAGQGRAVGIAAASGIATGILVHTLLVALGLAALFRSSPTAFEVVRYLGAAYLVALGLQTLRTAGDGAILGDSVPEPDAASTTRGGPSLVRAYGRGVTVNVLNPKVAVFFLAYLPGFAGSDPGATGRLNALGGLYGVLTLSYLFAVGVAAGKVGTLFRGRPWLERRLDDFAGIVLVMLGVGLGLEG